MQVTEEQALQLIYDLLKGNLGTTALVIFLFVLFVFLLDKHGSAFDRLEKWGKSLINLLKFKKKETQVEQPEEKEEDGSVQTVTLEKEHPVQENEIKKYLVGYFGSFSSGIEKSYSSLELQMVEIESVKTGDLVKDILLKDVATCIYNAVVHCMQKFLDEYEPSQPIEKTLVDLMIHVNDINKEYNLAFKRIGIQPKLMSKILSYFDDEEDIFLRSFKRYSSFDADLYKVPSNLEYVFAHYTSIIDMFKEQIKTMNGALNGVEYKQKVIGMYNSLGNIKIDRFPFPLGIFEVEVSNAMKRVDKMIGCDFYGLLDIYETPLFDSSVENFRVKQIINSKIAVTYSNAPSKFPYDKYINRKVSELFNETEISRLIDNEILIFDRHSLDEWSNIRKFLSIYASNSIIFQPILSGKQRLIGVCVYVYLDKKDHSKDEEDKEYLRSIAARMIPYFRHNIQEFS